MQSRSHKIGCYDNSSLWNLRVISVARLSKCLSNFIASEKVQSRTSQLWDLTRPCGKASVCLVNRGPVDRRCMALKGGAQLDLASSCAVRRSTYTANGSPYVTKLCPITELYWNCNRQGGGGVLRFRWESVSDRHVYGVDSTLKGIYFARQGTRQVTNPSSA